MIKVLQTVLNFMKYFKDQRFFLHICVSTLMKKAHFLQMIQTTTM